MEVERERATVGSDPGDFGSRWRSPQCGLPKPIADFLPALELVFGVVPSERAVDLFQFLDMASSR